MGLLTRSTAAPSLYGLADVTPPTMRSALPTSKLHYKLQ